MRSPPQSNDDLPPTLSTATLVQSPAKKTFLWLPINPRITRLNFVGYLVTTLFSVTFFVFLDSSQTFVLSELLGVTSSAGTISGDLAFYDELLSIFLVALWGSLSDRIGRRPVAVAGYLVMGLGLFVFTTAPNVYPTLLLCRLTFAIGAAAASAMITALTGDYSGAGGRGKVAAVAGLFSGLGALIGVFGLLPLPTQLAVGGDQGQAIKTTFYITGGIACAISLIAFALLKKDERSGWGEKGDGEETVEAKKTPFYMLIYKGFAAGKDLRVSLAYVCGFVARADSIIVTLFITLWVNEYYITNGLCTSTIDPYAANSVIKDSCNGAYITASTVSGVAEVLALIGAPIFGVLADRIPRSWCVLLAGACGVVAFFGLGSVPDPRSGIVYLYACLTGLAQIGSIVTSLALVSEGYVDGAIRGSVAGTYSLFGAIGILFITKLGGKLFDVYSYGAPFLVMGACHALVVAFAAVVVVIETREKRRKPKEKEGADA